jgi:flagellar basal-body rod modification protein FlgD
MEVTATANASGGAKNPGATSFSETFDTFLKLLTTQLKYQDPLSPMDTTEFTNQLTQFSQVEQSIRTNAGLDSLIKVSQANQAVAALGYIGKEVEAHSDAIQLQDGSATILYALPKSVTSSTITIMDDTGAVVRRITGETTAGRQEFVWDGKNESGVTMPDGAYSLKVVAYDVNGNELPDTIFGFSGVVDEVISEGGPIYLMIGDVAVPIENVAAVRNRT